MEDAGKYPEGAKCWGLRARYLDVSFLCFYSFFFLIYFFFYYLEANYFTCFYSESGLLKVVTKTAVSMAWF